MIALSTRDSVAPVRKARPKVKAFTSTFWRTHHEAVSGSREDPIVSASVLVSAQESLRKTLSGLPGDLDGKLVALQPEGCRAFLGYRSAASAGRFGSMGWHAWEGADR